jgi:hypothetical protein
MGARILLNLEMEELAADFSNLCSPSCAGLV